MGKQQRYLANIKPYGSACFTCEGKNEPYMLATTLWRATPKIWHNKCICISCVEDWLGRDLLRIDFHEQCPLINYGIFGFHIEDFLDSKLGDSNEN